MIDLPIAGGILTTTLGCLFVATQLLYLVVLSIDHFLQSGDVDWVRQEEIDAYEPERYPLIVLLYPVLRELEETMRTTLIGLGKLDYPSDRFRLIAIPNADDIETLASLQQLRAEFNFLEVMPVPATADPSWNLVWAAWEANLKAYWWWFGRRKGSRSLPAKKTRQLIYALYTLASEIVDEEDWLLNYIDADSVPPPDHLRAGAAGMERYDVVQATNVAGNLLSTWAASLHAMDHMAWDGCKYPHLSRGGKQPYWVLGKGLFYKASDLIELGGFNPWLTIEDPEVGLRLWVNGRRLGIIRAPLVEEVPSTIGRGITQRKRWVCGFLQTSHAPLKFMGMTWRQRFRARLNLWPCMFLALNPIGIPIGIWELITSLEAGGTLPRWLLGLCAANALAFLASLSIVYAATWKNTSHVLQSRARRIKYMLRVNPLVLMLYWAIWAIPIVIGTTMFLRDRGQTWERTEKIDANHRFVRRRASQQT